MQSICDAKNAQHEVILKQGGKDVHQPQVYASRESKGGQRQGFLAAFEGRATPK